MSRKLLFTTLVLLIAVSSSFAGSDKLSYGAMLGFNMANMSLDPKPAGVDVKSRFGFGFGGVVNYNLNDKMDIRTDILYLQKGAKAEGTGYSTTYEIDNLAIAPFWTYKFASWDCKAKPGSEANAFFQVGPEIGLNMKHKDSDSGKDLADWAGTEFALNLGAGTIIPMGKGHLVPNLRYSIGLSNLTTKSGATYKSNGLQIMFGYMF